MRDLTDLVRQATSQDGLLTTTELRTVGFDRSAQSRLVAAGILVRVRRGVVRLAGLASWRQELRSACLAAGRQSAAGHRSALRLWRLRSDLDVEISVPYPANCRIDKVTVLRSVDLSARDIMRCEDIPFTTPARTLCDAGLIFPPHEVQRMTDHAIATDLVGRAELIEVRRRVGEHGRNGVITLDQAIDGVPAGAEEAGSGPEVRLLRLIKEHGLPEPVRQQHVIVGGQSRYIDLAYPSRMIALEYDGNDPHTRVDRFVEDRRRQNAIVLAGWTVIRYTNEDLRDRPFVVVAQIRSLLHL